MIHNKIFKEIIDKHNNGIIILNKSKKVIYSNKKIKESFNSNFDLKNLLEIYLNCHHTLKEQIKCQEKTNCKSCIINNCLDRAFLTKEQQILSNINETLCLIDYISENYILEFLNFDKHNQKIMYLTQIIDKSEDLLFFKDSTLKYQYINNSFSNLIGVLKEDLYGNTINSFFTDTLSKQCFDGDLITLEKGRYSKIEKIYDKYYQVSKENINGGILGIAKDITNEIIEKNKAEIDILTGLFNRRKYLDVIKNIYLNKLDNYYLLLIDLDNLRELNNNNGHALGDLYLTKLGNILKELKVGTYFRLGGDEFAGLINKDLKQLKLIIENLFSTIKNTNLNPKLSISVGIKKLDLNISSINNYSLVDEILYEVKNNNKGSYLIK